MNRMSDTETGLGFWVVLCLLLAICGCSSNTELGLPEPSGVTNAVMVSTIARENDCYYYKLSTVEHDGHLYVLFYTGSGVSMLHHPDCPCRSGRFEEANQ